MAILKARRAWTDVVQTLSDYRCQLSLLYQQNYQSQYTENEKYSTIRPNENTTYTPIQLYKKN